MAKVIPFSRKFPHYHPRAGEPTYFVEQVLNALEINYQEESYMELLLKLNAKKLQTGKLTTDQLCVFWESLSDKVTSIKNHTCRGGNRWSVGDMFSPRVWSGRPYKDPQIIFAPERTVQKLWTFDITSGSYRVNNSDALNLQQLEIVAKNDGLSTDDFECWFNVPQFKGQIICWNELIEY